MTARLSPVERRTLVEALGSYDRRMAELYRGRRTDTQEFYSLRDRANTIRARLRDDDQKGAHA